MSDKENAKQQIVGLIEKYNKVKEENRVNGYNEEMTKKDFILPLFRILGWNIEDSSEVAAEENVSKKRVDYGFRINGILKFFLEAKSLKENLDNPDFIKQAIDYSWLKGCTWAVLTNFETIKIFNAEWKSSEPFQSHLKTISYQEFLDRFDELWLLSKESFEQGLLDKEAEKWGKRTKRIPVDKQLLADFTRFRELLSKSITKLNQNKNLTEEELDDSVQKILDRLIFIRNCEDRGYEEKTLLSNLREWENKGKGQLIEGLKEVFSYFGRQYNSEIFRTNLCDSLEIDNDVLHEIIEGLYYTKDKSASYDFSAIEADVLGNIYEQYLGHILKKGEKRTKLLESRVHRKEQGIYYTPTYIVDYIVRNTLGELLKNTKVDPEKIRVLDPACGSGSFLLKAFDILNEYYKEHDKNYSQAQLDTTGTGTTYSRKLKILQNNIFGVDLDEQAVEIARLNLLLKIAEKGQRLPLLQKNIKHGNSLIDDPIVAGDEAAFKWEEEFEEIMKEGGFDIIIGNPPYFTMQSTGEKIQKYFSSSDRWKSVYRGESDILYYFIIQGLKLLKEHGFLGFITSRYWLENKWADKLRDFILKNAKIIEIIDFRNYYVFSDSNIHTCIIILQKETDLAKRIKNQINVKIFSESDKQKIFEFLNKNNFKKVSQSILSRDPWILDARQNITLKMEKDSFSLGHLCFVSKGMDTGLNKAFIVDKDTIRMNKLENAILKKVIKNSDIKRYFLKDSGLYLIYTTDEININDYPNVKKWLESFKTELTNRWAYKRGNCSWFRLSTLRSKNLFDNSKEKIFTPYRATKNTFALDTNKFYGMTDTTIIVKRDEKINHLYLLGLLNSKLMNFYVLVTGKKKGTTYEYFADYLKKLPIRVVQESKQQHIIELVDKMLYLNKRLNETDDKETDERAKIEEEIKKTDEKIDELVYQIYGITEEEKKIIEETVC